MRANASEIRDHPLCSHAGERDPGVQVCQEAVRPVAHGRSARRPRPSARGRPLLPTRGHCIAGVASASPRAQEGKAGCRGWWHRGVRWPRPDRGGRGRHRQGGRSRLLRGVGVVQRRGARIREGCGAWAQHILPPAQAKLAHWSLRHGVLNVEHEDTGKPRNERGAEADASAVISHSWL